MGRLVKVSFIPWCDHCKNLIHDLLLFYRDVEDVYFYFIPYRSTPSYDDVPIYVREIVPFGSVGEAKTPYSDTVPVVFSGGRMISARSGVPSRIPYFRHHPTTLMPFIRYIGRKVENPHSPIDRRFKDEYNRFLSTVLGVKIEEEG